MVTKSTRSGAQGGPKDVPPDLAATVKDSAQQIWLAGLGAFAKAQEEGNKVFDTLVKEGVSLQRKTQSAAGEKFSEASSKIADMATEISSKASGSWDKLETIFEGRVAKTLAKLGVPTAADLQELSARVDELQRRMSKQPSGTASRKPAAGKSTRAASSSKPPATDKGR